jgi:hypothetical protein
MKPKKYSWIILFIPILMLQSGCIIKNTFHPIKELPTDHEKKRLIVFKASEVDDSLVVKQ